jgi:hypothetical protein
MPAQPSISTLRLPTRAIALLVALIVNIALVKLLALIASNTQQGKSLDQMEPVKTLVQATSLQRLMINTIRNVKAVTALIVGFAQTKKNSNANHVLTRLNSYSLKTEKMKENALHSALQRLSYRQEAQINTACRHVTLDSGKT